LRILFKTDKHKALLWVSLGDPLSKCDTVAWNQHSCSRMLIAKILLSRRRFGNPRIKPTWPTRNHRKTRASQKRSNFNRRNPRIKPTWSARNHWKTRASQKRSNFNRRNPRITPTRSHTKAQEKPSERKETKLQAKESPNKTDMASTEPQENRSERTEIKLQQKESPNKTDMAITKPQENPSIPKFRLRLVKVEVAYFSAFAHRLTYFKHVGVESGWRGLGGWVIGHTLDG